jgi:hypothetical protein
LETSARTGEEKLYFLPGTGSSPATADLTHPLAYLVAALLRDTSGVVSFSGELPFGGEWLQWASPPREPSPRQPPPTRSDFTNRLHEVLSESSVEPGDSHPAETLLAACLGRPEVGAWTHSFYENYPELRRSLLLCLGRLGPEAVGACPDLKRVLHSALEDRSLLLREAAVRATETLGRTGRELLAVHHEQVPWLKQYAERVLERLT